MYNSEFQDYLASKLGFSKEDINEIFSKNKTPFDVALDIIKIYNIDKNKLGQIWGNYFGFAYVDPNSSIVNPEFINKLGMKFINDNKVLPLYKFGRAVTVATCSPNNPFLLDKVEKQLDEIVSLVFCFPFDIENYFAKNS